jgi:hypothetical protein
MANKALSSAAAATKRKQASAPNTFKVARETHKNELALIAETMQSLAEEHNFCDVFYEAVKDLNKQLTVPIDIETPGITGTLRYLLEVRVNGVEGDGNDWGESPVDAVAGAIYDAIQRGVNAVRLDQGTVEFGCLDIEEYVEG